MQHAGRYVCTVSNLAGDDDDIERTDDGESDEFLVLAGRIDGATNEGPVVRRLHRVQHQTALVGENLQR